MTLVAEPDAVNVQITCCLEDAIEKLQINGQIMPLTYEMRVNAREVNIFFLLNACKRVHLITSLVIKILNETLYDLKENQKDAESKFGENFSTTTNSHSNSKIDTVTKNLKAAAHAINRSLKQSPFGADVFQKIELER
jgi:hypothetical protein